MLLESKIIEEQLQKVVNVLNEKMALRDFVIVQAINSLCRLQFSYADICRFVNISDSLLQSYAMDEDVREILDNDRQRFVISSAIYTQYLVRQSNMKKEMIEALTRLYEECAENDAWTKKYAQQRKFFGVKIQYKICLFHAKRN